jgi:excisionase family DNA binding protein
MKQADFTERLERIEKLLESQEPKPFTIQDAAEYLNVSKAYIYRLTSHHEVPFFKPNNKRVYFLKRDLDAWVMKRRSSSRSEISANA